MKSKFIYIFIPLTISIFSQNDTLNKFNDKGKKFGYWKCFYNANMMVINDTTNAVYYDFEYYINGTPFRFIPPKVFGTVFKFKDYFDKIKYFPKDVKANGKLLNGTMLYYDKYDNITYKEEFLNGLVMKLHCNNYIRDNKENILVYEELVDYTKPYNNKNSYYFEKKDYKILRDKWKTKKGYVIYLDNGKTKKIKY